MSTAVAYFDDHPVLAPAIADCLRKIKRDNYVSFVEIAEILDQHRIPTRGDIALEIAPNVFAWIAMTEEFYSVAWALIEAPGVELQSAPVVVYRIDGRVPKMPVLRDWDIAYLAPTWAPMVYARSVVVSA